MVTRLGAWNCPPPRSTAFATEVSHVSEPLGLGLGHRLLSIEIPPPGKKEVRMGVTTSLACHEDPIRSVLVRSPEVRTSDFDSLAHGIVVLASIWLAHPQCHPLLSNFE